MKKFASAVLICAVAVGLSGCAEPQKICGTTYESYGLANKDENKDPNIKYQLSVGNLIWGAVLFETIVGPIYFYGFSLFEPTPGQQPKCPAA